MKEIDPKTNKRPQNKTRFKTLADTLVYQFFGHAKMDETYCRLKQLFFR